MNISYYKFAFVFAITSLAAPQILHAVEKPMLAKAVLIDAKGIKKGEAVITETTDGGLSIQLQVKGLSPGKHGMHFHENGKCTPPDFESAGEHFNPTRSHHGNNAKAGPHAGDLPNLNVPASGVVKTTIIHDSVTLSPGLKSLFKAGGTSLVIHEGEDDELSEPTGHSGKKILCGVVEKVSSSKDLRKSLVPKN